MKVKLICNPYLAENIIKINDKVYEYSSKLSKYKHKPVHELKEEFLNDLSDELNNLDLTIEFSGTIYDYVELELLIKRYNQKRKTDIKLVAEKRLDSLYKDKEIEALIGLMKNSHIPELKDEKLIKNIRTTLNKNVKVAVIATMSSGKSTLINAMLGDTLMPSKSGACTSKIFNIFNSDEDDFTLIEMDKVKYDKKITLEDIKALNEDENIKNIYLRGNIKGLSSIKNLQLVDTPGPNNSLNIEHKKTTINYLKSAEKPIILFLLDGEKFLVDDESYLIRIIADETRRDGKVDEERFIFAVNKADKLDQDDDPGKMKKDLVETLSKYGINNPNIHFISSYNSLLTRMDRYNKKMTEDHLDDLETAEKRTKRGRYKFRLANDLPESVQVKLEKLLEKAHLDNDFDKIIDIESGMVGLELTVEYLIDKHKHVSLVRESVREIDKIVKEKRLRENINKLITERENEILNIEKSVVELREFLKKNDVREQFKSDIDKLQFPDSFKNVVLRIHSSLSQLKTEVTRLQKSNIGGKEYISKEHAEAYMEKFNKKYSEINIDLQTEYERFIEHDIYKVGETIINKHKENLLKFINNLNLGNPILDDLVELSMPNFKEFIQNNLQNKTEKYTDTVTNPERQGFWGSMKFWKPRYIEVEKSRTLKVIEIKDVIDFTGDIYKDIYTKIEEIKKSAEVHKKNIKHQLSENFGLLNSKIEERLLEIEAMLHCKGQLEAAITFEGDKINTLDIIEESLKKILSI